MTDKDKVTKPNPNLPTWLAAEKLRRDAERFNVEARQRSRTVIDNRNNR